MIVERVRRKGAESGRLSPYTLILGLEELLAKVAQIYEEIRC